MAKNWAIAIGVNSYDLLQPLNYAKRDAQLIQHFLRHEGGFEQVYFFSDDSPDVGGKSTRPSRTNLLRILRQLFDIPFMGAGDNFWFFFSGHGIRHADRDYLMPSDGDPEDIENTAIAINFVTERLRRCGADNVVLILDACRSLGTRGGEGIDKQTAEEARQQGVISIFSCSPQEYSYEIESLQQGAFTTALLEGLGIKGQCATVERLNQYLSFRVSEIVRQHKNARQTPYIIAEPVNKSHLILVPRYATLTDIATLKNDAYQAEVNQNLNLAEQLWIRVLAAASGTDMEAVKALQRIERLRTSTNPDIPQQPTPSVSKSSAKSVSPVSSNTPANHKPISSTSPTTFPSPPTINFSRRRVIQTVVFAGAGLGLTIIVPRLWSSDSGKSSTTTLPEPIDTGFVTPASTTPSRVSSNSLQTVQFETVTVNAQGSIINRKNEQAKYLVEDLGNGVTLEMMQIPGGTFTMGSPPGEPKRAETESPQHPVTVPGFFMGKYAVTQAQYQAIMGRNPAKFQGDKRPVEQVSWNDAVEFCKKLSEKTGRDYRLPSEAEWEYGCRGGTTTPFYFGDTITGDLANYDATNTYGSEPKGKFRQETTPVGSFPPNAFGLYDMHGNVWEWCLDDWHGDYNGAPRDGSAWVNKNDNRSQAGAVLRGGSWYNNPEFCRSAYRINVNIRVINTGFRVVCAAGRILR